MQHCSIVTPSARYAVNRASCGEVNRCGLRSTECTLLKQTGCVPSARSIAATGLRSQRLWECSGQRSAVRAQTAAAPHSDGQVQSGLLRKPEDDAKVESARAALQRVSTMR